MLHGKNITPHRSVWFLVFISIIVGIITTLVYQGGQSADLSPLDKHNFWVHSVGIWSPHSSQHATQLHVSSLR